MRWKWKVVSYKSNKQGALAPWMKWIFKGPKPPCCEYSKGLKPPCWLVNNLKILNFKINNYVW
jgi:hypothetical protein